MDRTQILCVGVDWIRLAQDTSRWGAVVNAMMNRRVVAQRI